MTSYCVECKHRLGSNIDLHRCAKYVNGVTGRPESCVDARGMFIRGSEYYDDDGKYKEPDCPLFESIEENDD